MSLKKIKQHVSRNPNQACILLLIFAPLLVFIDILFSSNRIISIETYSDIRNQFFYWREWGFDQILNGNFPLWNPHNLGGVPFFGSFQSALLYPPNWIHLFLPTAVAINLTVILHTILAGLFTYFYLKQRKLSYLSSLTGAFLFMFSGAYFTYTMAGNLSNLVTIPWLPLLLLSIDSYFLKKRTKAFALSVIAISMQILAGHIQLAVFFNVAAALYFLANYYFQTKKPFAPMKVALDIFKAYSSVAILTLSQIWAGLEVSSELLRTSQGLNFNLLSQFSFPPENLFTLFIPKIFGDRLNFDYWGRWAFWESNAFLTVTGTVLVVLAFFRERKQAIPLVICFFICLILALGRYTPVLEFLYNWVPGIQSFRGYGKFIIPTQFFLVVIAAIGLNALLKSKKLTSKTIVPALGLVSFCLFGFAIYVYAQPFSDTFDIMKEHSLAILEMRETPFSPFLAPKNISTSHYHFVSRQFLFSGVLFLGLAGLFVLIFRNRKYVSILALVAIIEALLFAFSVKTSFENKDFSKSEAGKFITRNLNDSRFFLEDTPARSMKISGFNIQGDSPAVLRRFSELFSKFRNIREPSILLVFKNVDPLFSLYRVKYELVENPFRTRKIKTSFDYAHVFYRWSVKPKLEGVVEALKSPNFLNSKTVIVAENPGFNPSSIISAEKVVSYRVDSDQSIFEIETKKPAILLISSNYSKNWKATSVNNSSPQVSYKVIPGFHSLIAIPIQAGNHLIRLEYILNGFRYGIWISILGMIGFLFYVWKRRNSIF